MSDLPLAKIDRKLPAKIQKSSHKKARPRKASFLSRISFEIDWYKHVITVRFIIKCEIRPDIQYKLFLKWFHADLYI